MNSMNNHVDSEQESEKRILDEFKNLSNEEAHEHVQRRLLALKRNVSTPKAPADFLGSDNRESLIPLMQNTLRGILESMNDSRKECYIFDVMPGSETQVDWFLAQELEKYIGKREHHLYVIEQNKKFLDSYKQRVKSYSHLKLGKTYDKKVKDYYQKLPDAKPMDFIICMDICFLTDYYEKIGHPENDIIDFVKFLYGLLRPGGALFLTYLDLDSPFSQINSNYFKEKEKENDGATQRIAQITKAREELLYNGNIVNHLNKLDESKKTCPKVESHKLSTFYYAQSLADVAVMSLDGGFLKYNKGKFDYNHLEFVVNKVREVASTDVNRGEKREFGLCKAERGRDPLWRVESLQYACIIRKEAIN
ncbi:6241_t:CDS:2 [Dentiscutata heterogama]|uniref:6241_t:CDS:1 n=1 Tax=Dentiscutata heterogama TaxID=1316150 RepID=A0ACA9P401_9GLOM|nr:6241_t:CDS:2 [Dentiscutata heterogama]